MSVRPGQWRRWPGCEMTTNDAGRSFGDWSRLLIDAAYDHERARAPMRPLPSASPEEKQRWQGHVVHLRVEAASEFRRRIV
eukprot:10926784-Alexandrium_andersonii.AAC.1